MPFEIRENVPLAPLTTLRVGGPARYFATATSETELADAFAYAEAKGLGVFVLGGGSNILVADRGFDGLVLQIAMKGITRNQKVTSDVEPERESLTVAAGEDWDEFVEYCVSNDLAGVECLSGIPGYVGGTPVQNVGAYGQEVSETITSVCCFDRGSREIIELANADCGFEYRNSIFNSTQRERFVVIAVTFELVRGGQPKLVYKDLREYFETRMPTLREVREAVVHIRRSKSMVIDEADPNSRSAGSFFKNPIIEQRRFEEIAGRYETVPQFPAGDGVVKIPSAWLIEQSGFHKGYKLGNAGISTKHTLAIINCGGAAASEIVELKDRIQSGVSETFGIELIPEPIFVGFDS